MNATRPHSTTPVETAAFSYAEWRERFLKLILRSAAIVGLVVAIVASIDTNPVIVALYIAAYLTILFVTLMPLSYRVRAVSFLAVILVLAITSLLETGIRADARLFLLAFVVMSAMLLGPRAGRIAIGVSLIPVLVVGFSIFIGQYTILSITIGGNATFMTWVVAVLTLLLMDILCLTGLTMLQQGFEQSLQRSRQLFETVQAERAALERRVADRTAQLHASADVGRAAVSVLDTNQLLREIVNLISDRFGFYYTAVFLADSTHKWAVLREATGEAGRILKERKHQLEIGGQSMVGTVMKTRKARIALDVGEEAVRFANPLLPDTRSEIALPLVVGTRVIGALDVQSTEAAAFDEASAAVLQSMADQIAIALSNTLQFQQAQATLQRTRQLYEASTAIANAADAEAVLQELMTRAVADASAAQILTYGPLDEAGQYAYLEVAASWATDDSVLKLPVGTRILPEQVLPISALATEPYILRNIADPSVPSEQQQNLQAVGMQAMLGYALVAGSQPTGLLLIFYREPHLFTPAETQPLLALAGQIAVTLRNQQLVREQVAARQQLDEINRRLTGQVWQQYARERGQAIRKIDVGPGMQPASSATSELTAPVLIHGQEIGQLRLEDATPDREWTPNEQALIQAVAGEVAIALENARLIEQTERRAQREQTISTITSQIYAAADVRKLLQVTAEELRRATNSARAVVKLGHADLPAGGPMIQPVSSNDGDAHPSEDGG